MDDAALRCATLAQQVKGRLRFSRFLSASIVVHLRFNCRFYFTAAPTNAAPTARNPPGLVLWQNGRLWCAVHPFPDLTPFPVRVTVAGELQRERAVMVEYSPIPSESLCPCHARKASCIGFALQPKNGAEKRLQDPETSSDSADLSSPTPLP